MSNVAILGSGPAGLLAAHAAARAKNAVTIFSEGDMSDIFGAQYLHRYIPDLTHEDPDFTIDVAKIGTKEGYAKLVYGDREMEVSWDHFEPGQIPGWDMRTAYRDLWRKYSDRIVRGKITWQDAARIAQDYDVVFSSIPAPSLCTRPSSHVFDSIPIWVVVEPPWMDDQEWADYNVMYYNGFPPDGSEGGTIGYEWYRFSKINKWKCWEYAEAPETGLVIYGDRYIVNGKKPIHETNCDCAEQYGWRPIGRWGHWRRGELTHHAYEEVERALLTV